MNAFVYNPTIIIQMSFCSKIQIYGPNQWIERLTQRMPTLNIN